MRAKRQGLLNTNKEIQFFKNLHNLLVILTKVCKSVGTKKQVSKAKKRALEEFVSVDLVPPYNLYRNTIFKKTTQFFDECDPNTIDTIINQFFVGLVNSAPPTIIGPLQKTFFNTL